MSKTGSVGSSFGGSGGVDSSVAGGVGCSFSVGAAVSGRRSDSPVFFSGSLGCGSTAVLWSACSGTSVGWVALSDTLAVASAEWSSSFGSVLRGCSTSVFSVACAVSDWSGASLLPEEETGTGCSAICEVLLHPEVRHKRTRKKELRFWISYASLPSTTFYPMRTAPTKVRFEAQLFIISPVGAILNCAISEPLLDRLI